LHETAGLFAFKAKYTTKIYCKTTKYIFAKWKTIFLCELVLAHVHNVEDCPSRMEDNFALCYVLKHPSVNSQAELAPLPPGLCAVGSGTSLYTLAYT
jgi:hypothetical protein